MSIPAGKVSLEGLSKLHTWSPAFHAHTRPMIRQAACAHAMLSRTCNFSVPVTFRVTGSAARGFRQIEVIKRDPKVERLRIRHGTRRSAPQPIAHQFVASNIRKHLVATRANRTRIESSRKFVLPAFASRRPSALCVTVRSAVCKGYNFFGDKSSRTHFPTFTQAASTMRQPSVPTHTGSVDNRVTGHRKPQI